MKKYWEFLNCLFLVMITISFSIFAQTTERKKPELKDFGSSLNRPPEENLAPKKVSVNNAVNETDVIRIDTNLVVIDFLVLDKKGHAIYGLKKEDFIVTEDNQPQEIQTFTLGDDTTVPRSIALIIDYSGSLAPYIERGVKIEVKNHPDYIVWGRKSYLARLPD